MARRKGASRARLYVFTAVAATLAVVVGSSYGVHLGRASAIGLTAGEGGAAAGPVVSPETPAASPSPERVPPQATVDADDVVVSTVTERVTNAVRAYVSGTDGHVGVMVVDQVTGVRVAVNDNRAFITASVVKVDILATLLLRRQASGDGLSDGENDLARAMITQSDNDAASSLWNVIGGGTGLSAANRTFGLSSTHADQDGYWGLSTTTPADQVHLLGLLTSANSPLNAHSRQYILTLMSQVASGQRWGVPAAAGPASRGVYVKNGWLPYDGAWVTHSVGRIVEPGHDWLLAVMSDGQRSEPTGIANIEHIATLVVDAERSP